MINKLIILHNNLLYFFYNELYGNYDVLLTLCYEVKNGKDYWY